MPPAWVRIFRALFVIYVAATVVHVGWVMAHEPFGFDAWNVAVDTHAKPFRAGRFVNYWWFEYTHSNPRIGQALTYLSYKLEYFAVVATPLAYLAIALATFVLGTGRWPSWRRGRDLALVAIAIGSIWFAFPQVGKTLFNRAYGANYLYGLAIQLWFLVPLRRRPEGQSSLDAATAYFGVGVIAGLCNEHTGPTLCAFMLGYAWWTTRRTRQRPLLAWGGALGALVGFGLIFFAPGQEERYEGLAQKLTLSQRFLQRGVGGNLEILRDLLLAAAPLLALIVIVLVLARDADDDGRVRIRRALDFLVLVAVAAIAMAITIFVSPKLGPRFYYASTALLLAVFLRLADAVLATRALAAFVALAVISSTYAVAHTVPLYQRVSRASATRMAALAAAPSGSIFTADALEQVDDSWWFLGDDLRDPRKRDMVASYFGLGGVVFRAYDPNAPLGVAGVRLVARAELDPPGCLDGFTLGSFKGFDIAAIHREMKMAIQQTRERIAPTQLRRLTLEIELDGVELPRPHLLVGRWTPDSFEGWVGTFQRKGRSTTRTIGLPRELARLEVYIYQVGGELRRLGPELSYVPWKTGVYWVLVCTGDECLVVAATKQAA